MALRRRFFSDGTRRRHLAGSVLDDDWLEVAADTGPGPWMFVAEAVLGFLDEHDVHNVLAQVAGRFPGSLAAFDSWGEWMRQNQEQHDALSKVDARARWFCENPADLERQVPGLEILESRTLPEAPRAVLDRLPSEVSAAMPARHEDPQVRSYRLNLVRLGEPSTG
ncbi:MULTISPECIES: hypothetical protein [unclassified Frankia]